MLRKLFAYDFKAIGKTMWLFTAIAVVLATVACLAYVGMDMVMDEILDMPYYEGEAYDSGREMALYAISTACGMAMVICIFGLVAYCVLGMIMILVRYYTNMFTDEGYLTFTLPVKTSTILNAKVLSGVTWLTIVLAVFFAGIFSFIITISVMNGEDVIEGGVFPYAEPSVVYEYLEGIIGFLEINSFIVAILSLVTGIYFCVTLATIIAKRARVVLGLGLFFGVSSTLSTIITVADFFISEMSYSGAFDGYEYYADTIGQDLFFIIVYGAVAVGAYLLNRYLLKNKLNLQ